MSSDMTVQCGNGLINIRVGAIIIKAGKILMVDSERKICNKLYLLGGIYNA